MQGETNEMIVSEIQHLTAGERERRKELLNLLVTENTGLMYTVARRFSGYLDFEDAFQECFFGLCTAAEKYNPERGAFSTYALACMRSAVFRYFRRTAHTVRIPEGCQSKISAMGRGEITDKLEINKLKEIFLIMDPVSLDAPLGDEKGETVGDIQPDTTNTITALLEKVNVQELKAVLWKMVDSLPEREAAVLRARYLSGMTYQETAETLNLKSKSHAHHWERTALQKLRKSRNLRVLSSFLYD